MSVTYLIAFDKGTELQKINYFYKHILNSKKTVFSENDGIKFDKELWPQEMDIAQNLFQGRDVYAIRSSVPMSYKPTDNVVSDEYLQCEKEQLEWFKQFVKKHLTKFNDILFLQIGLGHPINYYKILSKQIPIDTLEFPEDEFCFEPYIYQFVLE